MTDLALSCLVCQQDSGTRVVCKACQPYLNDNQYDRAMRLLHELVVKRDGEVCSYCGYEPANEQGIGWESGELCANHEETQGAQPALRFDTSICRSSCKKCNGLHADGKLPSQPTMKQDDKKPKQPKKKFCSEPHCPLLPLANGKCIRHQPKK